MARPRRLAGVSSLLLAVLLTWLAPLVASAATVAFSIKDARITESSGLAADEAAGLYWTVNDSGSAGVAYGIGPTGKVTGSLNFRAKPVDVEAVALHGDRLYVADIGDNDGKRDTVTVYYFDAPRANGLTVTYHSYDFRYADGAHDAETLLINPAGRLFVVTKGSKGAVYAAPAKPSRDAVNKLTKVGDAPALVTDGTFLPGGKQIALLSPTKVTVVDATSYAEVGSSDIPKQPQAESLAVSLDETSLLVGSEGKNSKVYSMAVPSSASASATPSAGSDDDSDVPDDNSDSSSGLFGSGTLLAVGLAAVVAVVAGLVVALIRKRS